MENIYTIIIPVFNEYSKIPNLMTGLKDYSDSGHEILIIDDGSDDNTYNALLRYNFINLVRLNKNEGKGVALRIGLNKAKNNKIIIFDGDLELNPIEIEKLMILNMNVGIKSVFASRYEKINPFNSFWDLGNFLLTGLFNFIHKSNLKDALCCAKAFYKSEIKIKKLNAKKFDIDVEISSLLVKNNKNQNSINLTYQRRTKKEGKKLKLLDSFRVIKRILK